MDLLIGGGGDTPLLFSSHTLVNAILCFPVDLQQPCHQVCIIVHRYRRTDPLRGVGGGGVGGSDLHLQGPDRRSVLPPGASTLMHEDTLTRTAYRVGACKAQFCLDSNAQGLQRYLCWRRLA